MKKNKEKSKKTQKQIKDCSNFEFIHVLVHIPLILVHVPEKNPQQNNLQSKHVCSIRQNAQLNVHFRSSREELL